MSLEEWCVLNDTEHKLIEWQGLLSDDNVPSAPNKVSFFSDEIGVWRCEKCGNILNLPIKDRVLIDDLPCFCKKEILKRAKTQKKPNRDLQIKSALRKLNSSLLHESIIFYMKKVFGDIELFKTFNWLHNTYLDIFIPSENTGVIFHAKDADHEKGYRDCWKSEKAEDMHRSKACEDNGVKLVHIFEIEKSYDLPHDYILLYDIKEERENTDDFINDMIGYFHMNKNAAKSVYIDLEHDSEEFLLYLKERCTDFSLANTWPEILDYWMFDKNPIGPYDIDRSSGDLFWLRCPKCGREYQFKPSDSYMAVKPCPCEKLEIESEYAKALTSFGKLHQFYFDNSLKARRIYDKILALSNQSENLTDLEKRFTAYIGKPQKSMLAKLFKASVFTTLSP